MTDPKTYDGTNHAWTEARKGTLAALGFEVGTKPTRDWKPGKVWVARDGIFPKSSKCRNRHAAFESRLEAVAHLHLSVDYRIREYVCQPEALSYWMPDKNGGLTPHQYTPDFVALTQADELLVIDAKARWFCEQDRWRHREPFIREACQTQWRAELVIWSEAELLAEPRLSNARTLYRHRFAPQDKTVEFAVRAEIARASDQTSIGAICSAVCESVCVDEARCFSAIMRLALGNEVEISQDCRIDRNSLVRLAGVRDD
ncbi:hypothetical protein [Oceanicaulis sp.]|uniref:hypothetical protein n=1 Tax=Oceanicaulis sp. TaxID=1924941 RepID=UPI003BAC9620